MKICKYCGKENPMSNLESLYNSLQEASAEELGLAGETLGDQETIMHSICAYTLGTVMGCVEKAMQKPD